MSDEFMGDPPIVVAPAATPAEAKPEAKAAEYGEFLEAIVNPETGLPKYKSVPDALLGAAKAQEFIETLKRENAELREHKNRAVTSEQLLQELGQRPEPTRPNQPQVPLESVVNSVLEQREVQNRERVNKQAVLSALEAQFSDKTQEVLKAKADELGLTVQELGNLAARSPKAVLSYFGSLAKGTPSVQGTVNSEALRPAPADMKTPANLLWGASNKEQVAFMRQVKEQVNKDLGLN